LTIRPLNSATAGFLIHRSALLQYQYYEEGLQFSRELVAMLNAAQGEHCQTALFEERFGVMGRVHWFVALRNPNDYKRLLDMIDHDEKWRQWAAMDRLPTRGGGAWDRIFLEGGISERVLCPQHGVGTEHEDAEDEAVYFQPPAINQSGLPLDRLVHSGNAALIVHRSANVYYQVREEARFYLFQWAQRITQGLPGRVSIYTYEEIWNKQDRVHVLLHFAAPEDVTAFQEFERTDEELRRIQQVAYATGTDGDGLWPYLLVPGSVSDVVLTPVSLP